MRKLNPYFAIPIAIVIVIAIATSFSKRKYDQHTETLETVDSIIVEECNEEFGIDLEGLHVEKGKIRQNQFLADILLPYGIDYGQITRLAETDVEQARRLDRGAREPFSQAVDGPRITGQATRSGVQMPLVWRGHRATGLRGCRSFQTL